MGLLCETGHGGLSVPSGLQIKMAEQQNTHASSPSAAGKAARGCFAGLLSPFSPASPAWLRGSLLLLHGFLRDQRLCPGLDLL